jgi:hypothetical protein
MVDATMALFTGPSGADWQAINIKLRHYHQLKWPPATFFAFNWLDSYSKKFDDVNGRQTRTAKKFIIIRRKNTRPAGTR